VHINKTGWVMESQHDLARYHHFTQHIITSLNHNTLLIFLHTTTTQYHFTQSIADARDRSVRKFNFCTTVQIQFLLSTRDDAMTILMLNSCKTHKQQSIHSVYPFIHMLL